MSKKETAQDYWNIRSDLFANYYVKPSLFDRVFRKAVYGRASVVMRTIEEYPDPHVLDVGSGPGVNSVTWLKNVEKASLLGIDFAPSMIDFSNSLIEKEGLQDRARFVLGDFMDYDFGDEKFDVTAAVGVFDYIENAKQFLAKMRDVTTPGGALVTSWPKNGIRMALRRYRYTCPVYHYTEDQLFKLHESLGITDVAIARAGNAGWTLVANKS